MIALKRKLLSRSETFLGLLIIVFISFSNAALACPIMEEASPRVGSEGAAPKEVVLKFTSKISPEKSTIDVTDETGIAVNLGQVYGKAGSDKLVATKVASLKPGRYKVKWDVLCDCGDMNPGTYEFTVE